MAYEADLQRQCVQLLRAAGLTPYRINAGLFGARKVRSAPKGWPDLCFLLPPHGRFVGVELKSPGGEQSEDQAVIQAEIEQMGGAYAIVRSGGDLIDLLTSLGRVFDAQGR